MVRRGRSRTIGSGALLAALLAPLAGQTPLVEAGPVGRTAPRADPAEADFLALTPEMVRFLDERVSRKQSEQAILSSLLDAVFGKDGLGITYGNTRTKTAAETFESGSGNCLSFTMLFVALARHLGLRAYFDEVAEILSWDRRGEIEVGNRHMFAEVETHEGLVRVDFLPGPEKRYRSVRRIDDHRARAHYFNNLGAEALADGDEERAVGLFERALAADPELVLAWVNLGVAKRRMDDPRGAEASYLRALEIDPDATAAASNLAGLYQIMGRDKEAEELRHKVRRYQQRNPFHHFRLGIEASSRGDLETARRRIRRAIRLLPEDAQFRAELAEVHARAGRRSKAVRSLKRALRLEVDPRFRPRLERRLAELEG